MARSSRKKTITSFDTDTGEVYETPVDAVQDTPIEEPSEGPLPLFPDLDRDSDRIPTTIRVYRITPTSRSGAYCGHTPATVTEEAIAKTFGNGTYKLALVNDKGVVLKWRSDVEIDMQLDKAPITPQPAHTGMSSDEIIRILKEERLRTESILAAERESIRKQAADEQHRSDAFLQLVNNSRSVEGEQTRQFFNAQAKQQQDVFAQVLGLMQAGHQQQLQMMQMQQAMNAQNNNPQALLQTFIAGMNMGGGDDDKADAPDPTLGFLNSAGGIIGSLAQLASASKPSPLMMPPPPQAPRMMAPVPQPRPLGAPQAPRPAGAPPVAKRPMARAPNPGIVPPSGLTPGEHKEIIELKALVNANGMDLQTLVGMAKQNLGAPAPAPMVTPPPAPVPNPGIEYDEEGEDDLDDEGDFDDTLDDDTNELAGFEERAAKLRGSKANGTTANSLPSGGHSLS